MGARVSHALEKEAPSLFAQVTDAMAGRISVVVHGGAWAIPDDLAEVW